MTARKTYDVLAECFLRERTQTCFALLGDANMNWGTKLAEGGCSMVYVRHEHCAVAAAMSFARATGDVGVATVTCGPGLTQLMTALPAAVRASIPLVVFAGEAPLKANWYNQELEQAPFVTATGAAYHQLHHIERMPVQIRDAFVQARMEMRPVVLGVPFDLQARDWPGDVDLPAPSFEIMPKVSPMPPHPDDVAHVAGLVADAKRVIVMAGRGAYLSGAAAECRALAERCGGLLATSLPVRGLFNDDPFSLGIAGGFSTDVARECFGEADLVIAVGGRLAQHNTAGGKLFPQARVIQIDVRPLAVSQGRVAADAHLRADAREGVRALLEALGPRPSGAETWRSDALARKIRETPADSTQFPAQQGAHDPRDVVAALEACLPFDWEMVNSSGHCSYYFAQMPSRPVERFHTIREFGAIGNGISFAIGVAAARPDSTVVLFDGDGSLMMHVQELETIRRHGMNILICIMNDGAYGSEIHKLRSEGLSDAGATFGRTDLAAISRGFGLGGERVDDLGTLPELIARFSREGGAAVFDFPVSDLVTSPVMRAAHPPRH
ncbi:thiamine pyrophosphate-binding protein [Lutibaculum baratangense]|uniref:TPP-requiring enzyme co-localized with fatty acid metabolic n=1 Tax=Lutibaculum baratangense AMV1 TaxID=631454 RepID=V4TMI2_9HYPH|nr:thiamine pyrophosphate-binding protein [Lutibaculum baratangense]ESR26953.1 TPP-requiring enzyme co-localized with fatty acid metabolic [Lutibaculum baratangense AMV1]